MNLLLDPRAHAPRKIAVKAIGALGLAGGALCAVTTALPPPAEGSRELVIGTGAVSGLAGAWALWLKPRLGELALGLMVLLGTALITVATREAGLSGGAADNEILYLWTCLYAFYFLSLPNALLQLGAVGAAYGWVLSGQETESALTQWVVTMSTLLVSGLIIATMRAQIYGLVNELSERASRDGLTGLLNRVSFEERFALEQARAARDGSRLSVLAVDIDEFKPLNDSHGHPTGDKVLRLVATALQHWTREIDATARIGGDEFAVLLAGTGPAEAIEVAEDLRAAIARTAGPAEVRTTVSIGVASSGPGGADFADLWQAADAAMYESKHSGGDKVSFREPAGGVGPRPTRAAKVPLAG